MAIRTFLALDLDEATRGRLARAAGELRVGDAKVRWVDRQNLHVTVKFLGDLADVELADVCRAVARAVEIVEPFDFTVRGIQAAPARGEPRMFWAGVEDSQGGLAEMFDLVETALEERGFPRERREFRPHVTLGRVKSSRDARSLRSAATPWADTEFGSISADEIVAYSSELTREGPVYAALGRCGFAPPAEAGEEP